MADRVDPLNGGPGKGQREEAGYLSGYFQGWSDHKADRPYGAGLTGDPWYVPEEHRPTCSTSGSACTSWTCLVDRCVASVEGVHHVEPSYVRVNGIDVPCRLGAIQFEPDCVTVVCCDCGQEVEKDA